MQGSAVHLTHQPPPGDIAPAQFRAFQLRQFLTMSAIALLGVVLLLGAQPAWANESATFFDDSMLNALYATYGEAAYRRGLRLNRLLEGLRTSDVHTQLVKVNQFFNRFTYRSDMALWKSRDHWATPLQFLGKHGGDCEDFVISKYFALRALGVTDEHLSMTYVKVVNGDTPHMVLSYYDSPDSVPLILDTHELAVRPATEHRNLVPVYGFNESSLFLSKPSFIPGKALPAGQFRNSKWDGLLSAVKRQEAHLHFASRSDQRLHLSSAASLSTTDVQS